MHARFFFSKNVASFVAKPNETYGAARVPRDGNFLQILLAYTVQRRAVRSLYGRLGAGGLVAWEE